MRMLSSSKATIAAPGNSLNHYSAPLCAPIVADVDGDGQGEILVVTRDGKLRCLAGER